MDTCGNHTKYNFGIGVELYGALMSIAACSHKRGEDHSDHSIAAVDEELQGVFWVVQPLH